MLRSRSRALIWREPSNARQAWLIVIIIIAVWSGLTLNTPAFTWCVVPLFFMALRVFPTRGAIPLIILLTLVAGVAEGAHHRQPWDPSPIIAPAVIAIMGTVIYRQLQRENARLVRTRDALASSERSSGVLAERVRLAREIHDTLAQGLSSMHLLLNAADQEWTPAPGTAREHVRQAAGIAQAAAAGETVLSAPVASKLMRRFRAPQVALSPREIEILELLAAGRTNREISKVLFISEATVKTHLAHIYGKLGVDSRTAAVRAAVDRRLIRL